MPKNALFQKSHPPGLLSPRADSKHNSVTNMFMGTCQQAHPQIFEAFPRLNYQPDVWQNWCGHAPIASPPACFVQNTILFGVNRHYQAFKQRWKTPTFVSQGACRLMFPGMYPVALGPDCAAGFVLVRRSWLVTVWLTHSAVMWGHLYGSIRCSLVAK